MQLGLCPKLFQRTCAYALQVLVQQLFDTAAELIQGALCSAETSACIVCLEGPNLENQATLMENGICSEPRVLRVLKVVKDDHILASAAQRCGH